MADKRCESKHRKLRCEKPAGHDYYCWNVGTGYVQVWNAFRGPRHG